eukprot:TRINITY_DN3157_c0_g1_i1.p2 TRINITY_DN3157_c0_g1~~TRINITY_DN3157_c0_g1_i1.p2  ORF type:complete len:192 (+),score=77.46 TRINITY_DN3157_c0_g1_i1:75-578(+)
MPPSLAAVGVVSRHNSPLFIRVCAPAQGAEAGELQLQCAMFAALDPVMKKAHEAAQPSAAPTQRQPSAGQPAPDNKFLGCVLPTGDYRVYAHTSNTKVKLFAVTRGEAREGELQLLLRQLHELYTQAVCDPFYELETQITSERFRAGVDRALRACVLHDPPPVALGK